MIASQGFGIEQIPKLKHDKDCEELALVVKQNTGIVIMFKQVDQQGEEQDEKANPIPIIPFHMLFVMMKSVCLRGFSFITSRDGGNDASAIAAKVSMMRLTQRICVTVRGISVPMRAPPRTSSSAVTLTMSWKNKNRWMFL